MFILPLVVISYVVTPNATRSMLLWGCICNVTNVSSVCMCGTWIVKALSCVVYWSGEPGYNTLVYDHLPIVLVSCVSLSHIRASLLWHFYVMEVKYKEFIDMVPHIFRDKPSCALAELTMFKDITLDILLFHYDKYPGVKMNGFGVEALQALEGSWAALAHNKPVGRCLLGNCTHKFVS